MIQEYLLNLSFQDKILGSVLVFLMFLIIVIKYVLVFKLHKKKDEIIEEKQAVSVVITSQNDAIFLSKYLEHFLKQDYPNYEVIVVDDCSYDDTQTVLAEYMALYPHLRVSTIKPDDKFTHTRKFALNIGLKAAKNDIVLFSEANCYPVSTKWIDYMQSAFKPGVDVVVAYSNYINSKSFKGSFLIYDRFIRSVRSLAFTLRGKPYRGDGANIAYRKSTYFKYNCFAGNSQMEAGYDSLPVIKMANKNNVSVVLHPDSYVLVDYLNIKKEWKHYKSLYYLTRIFYRRGLKFNIDLLPFLRLLVWVVMLMFIVVSEHKLLVMSMWAVYQVLVVVHKKILTNILNERKLFVYSISADLVIGVLSFVQFLKTRFSWFYGTTFKSVR